MNLSKAAAEVHSSGIRRERPYKLFLFHRYAGQISFCICSRFILPGP